MDYIPNILFPNNDETFLSYLYRLACANGISLQEFLYYYIFHSFPYKKLKKLNVAMSLEMLSILVCPFINLTINEFIIKCSLHSFYIPFLNYTKQQEFFTLANAKGKNDNYLDIIFNTRGPPKICPKCMQDKKYRYIHRVHQCPGVSVCHIHKCQLVKGANSFSKNKPLFEVSNRLIEMKTFGNIDEEYKYSLICEEILSIGKLTPVQNLQSLKDIINIKCNEMLSKDVVDPIHFWGLKIWPSVFNSMFSHAAYELINCETVSSSRLTYTALLGVTFISNNFENYKNFIEYQERNLGEAYGIPDY